MTVKAIRVEMYTLRVLKRILNKKRRVLFKQGAYLKTTMQRSMRYSNKRSEPGKPPTAHKPHALLRKLIEFNVDIDAGSVVCGPKKITGGTGSKSTKPLPQLLDQGGDVTIETKFIDIRTAFIENIKGPSVVAHIAPRPFTAPVFTDGGEKFRKLLNQVPL